MITIVVALLVWYIFMALSYGLNGGQLGRGRWWVLECLWQDVTWYLLPGGLKRRADFMLDHVAPLPGYPPINGWIACRNRTWRYSEIVDENTATLAALDALPSAKEWITIQAVVILFSWWAGELASIISEAARGL